MEKGRVAHPAPRGLTEPHLAAAHITNSSSLVKLLSLMALQVRSLAATHLQRNPLGTIRYDAPQLLTRQRITAWAGSRVLSGMVASSCPIPAWHGLGCYAGHQPRIGRYSIDTFQKYPKHGAASSAEDRFHMTGEGHGSPSGTHMGSLMPHLLAAYIWNPSPLVKLPPLRA